jgi:hypothetical protein
MRIQSPYLAGGFEWLRGNLHTHTVESDGASTPAQVIAEYERLGYDFLCISDHDVLVRPEDYQSLTKMTLIPGEEITDEGNHILAIDIKTVVNPVEDRQVNINETDAQGGFTIIAHPNWERDFDHAPQQLMEKLQGYTGVEIYNGVVERLCGCALATDRWDMLLSIGRRLWGYANDDEHLLSDAGWGWNVVQAKDRSAAAIIDALRNGRFYASTGVTISEIGAAGDRIHVTAPNAQHIRFVGSFGQVLTRFNASQAEYEVNGSERYVRIECYGEGVAMAWSQPFYVE